ncbi:MAG: HAD hydrolase-like protein [Candidatus Ruminococcus intestinipullorum]|nr:HAD hydrolase-like protein [Candidatus Ruminococcus intestinipullorum]
MSSTPFLNYKKKREYLVCVDSDGCAIDSMDVKHMKCFGPCMIEQWNLQKHQDEILEKWNEINLYKMTRGINRFLGLALCLKEVNQKICPIEDIVSLEEWVEKTDELSNTSIEKAAREIGSICLEKAYQWSKAVNAAIQNLPEEEIRPFQGVKEQLKALHESCDVVVVSSANEEAVREEWKRFGLIEFVDLILAQNAGSKRTCIEKMLSYGYDKEHVVMIRDALGDMEAAQQNGIFYYPILVKKEVISWGHIPEALQRIKDGDFAGEYQEILKKEFVENLS